MNKKLSEQELKLLKLSSSKAKNIIQLSGKPSTNFQEFFKRLFSRKVTILAMLVFLALVLTAFVILFTSPFKANEPISNDTLKIIGNRLPSIINDGWEEVLIETETDKITWKNLLGDENFKIDKLNDDVTIGKINITKFVNQGSERISFILGTNSFGQDNWTRVWVGLLNSLKLALFVTTIEFAIGFAIGAFIGFNAGSKIDIYFMRFLDILSGIPSLVWLILMSFILGTGFFALSWALISIGWIGPVYLTRMYVLKVKDLDYIHAAKTIGVSKTKLVFKHAVPSVLGRILSNFIRRIPYIIFTQAGLAFLGLVSSDSVD